MKKTLATIFLLCLACQPGINYFQRPPYILSMFVSINTCTTSETVIISVNAEDKNDDAINYIWVISEGTIIEDNGDSIIWKAPQITGDYKITVFVSDGFSDILNTQSITISVVNAYEENSTPVDTLEEAPHILPKSLITEYLFNGEVHDSIGNQNEATINGAKLSTDRFGNANSAFTFDGIDDYIEIKTNDLDFSDSDHSISFWIMVNGFVDDDGIIHFTNYSDTDGDGRPSYYLIQTNIGGRLEYRAAVNLPGEDDRVWGYETSTAIELNSWLHIVTLRDGNNWILYINNIKQTEMTWSGALEKPTSLLLGKGPSNHIYFNGKIDDIRIYNRALLSSEIESLYKEKY